MKTFSLLIVLLLVVALFDSGVCKQCLKLDTGDVSQFDAKKFEGRYEMVLGIMDATADKLTLNCNGMTLKTHDHPKGGVNVAIIVEDIDEARTVLDSVLPHFNSSKDTIGVEIDSYDQFFKKWTDKYFKVILATDDVLGLATCVHDEDNENNDEFFVTVFRKEGSKIPVSSIREMLPDVIKNKPEFRVICDH